MSRVTSPIDSMMMKRRRDEVLVYIELRHDSAQKYAAVNLDPKLDLTPEDLLQMSVELCLQYYQSNHNEQDKDIIFK
jgi:hypothetical protein